MFDVFIPLRMNKKALNPSWSEHGLLVFYPTEKTSKHKRCPNIGIGGERLICTGKVTTEGSLIFDPKRRVVYLLSEVSLNWPVER